MLLLLLLWWSPGQARAGQPDPVAYLKQFGYISSGGDMPGGQGGSLAQQSPVELEGGLRQLQHFAGIPVTGSLDTATLKVMSLPRCGVADKGGRSSPLLQVNSSIAGEYNLQGSRWKKKLLTYRVVEYSTWASRSMVNNDVRKAFSLWSQVADLTFLEKLRGDVDIEISYVTKEHGDGDPFDGPGGTLAHAYYPIYGGDVHMDDSEDWTAGVPRGTNMLQTLVHELGHSLGLSHSSVRGAVMQPFATGYSPDFSLSQDDIWAVQALYGAAARPGTTAPPPTVRPSGPPGIPSFQCPDLGTNTVGREAAEVREGVRDWRTCSQLCRDRPNCRYWTWHHEEAGDFALRCVTMTDSLTSSPDPNAVSGTKRCLGAAGRLDCPSRDTNLQGRQGGEVQGRTESWRECARLCSRKQGCSYWVWHPQDDHEASKRCVTMTGFSNTAQDSQAVAGSSDCQ